MGGTLCCSVPGTIQQRHTITFVAGRQVNNEQYYKVEEEFPHQKFLQRIQTMFKKQCIGER